MLEKSTPTGSQEADCAAGKLVTIGRERWYVISDVHRMEPFFISVISNADHWLFISSTGGLTAGRVSPETALFPYCAVDKIHDSALHTGSKTIVRIHDKGQQTCWEPFNCEHDHHFAITRNLLKNEIGNKLCFEEVNHDLGLVFRYTWSTSDRYGFIRQSELKNLAGENRTIEIIDGLQNILPAGTPRHTQSEASNLVNAYKWNEIVDGTGLAIFALYSGISDRAEPRESLQANTAFCLGLEGRTLLSSAQLHAFRRGETPIEENLVRGIRGAYLVNGDFELEAGETRDWQIVADVEQSQGQVSGLRRELQDPDALTVNLANSITRGSDELARIMASADGFQSVAEDNVSLHHYANVLFNVLRGGIFNDQYRVSGTDVANSIRNANRKVFEDNKDLLVALPESIEFPELLEVAWKSGDPQLARLCYEYLPITFGRRHGDPSRPWNHFAIRLKDEDGNRLLSYQGNWRDIFQNWEALAFSYPEFIENIVAKFVNASTMDGYNPYRITKEGIDWEIEDPDDPWSYIGYWGDHQIIYLLKLLELSRDFHPQRLAKLLREPIFSYANVPYRIRDLDALLDDPKHTVDFDLKAAEKIEERVSRLGADGKLVLDSDGKVYQVNLLDKLLIPLLAKLGNLVVDGGIWLNTQRPEWNDANNALVGHGLSMVTLYYMRRYVALMQSLLADESEPAELSIEVTIWLTDTATALKNIEASLANGSISDDQRYQFLRQLGAAAERYRHKVYKQETLSGKATLPVENIRNMLRDTLLVIDHAIAANVRQDGLFHAYNLMDLDSVGVGVDTMYPMLEGQVAALSSGAIPPQQAIATVEALFSSDIYRDDQRSFMLYPDRQLPGFLEKNNVPPEDVEAIPLLRDMLANGDDRIVLRDADGRYRFSADFGNVRDLEKQIDRLDGEYGTQAGAAREPLTKLYEKVFHHKEFTGRSGTMFGFEGLGSIYWHMVAKLLLAIEEHYFAAIDGDAEEATCKRLGELYYKVREGLGFNKTPAEYGAFPTDPYSHTPRHAGARQPGMTGQVKEEVLTRFAELGVRVCGGVVCFDPRLLRAREFATASRTFRYLDVAGTWNEIAVPANAIAFTWCQLPIIYRLDEGDSARLVVTFDDGTTEEQSELQLSPELSEELFKRSGRIRQIDIHLDSGLLFQE